MCGWSRCSDIDWHLVQDTKTALLLFSAAREKLQAALTAGDWEPLVAAQVRHLFEPLTVLHELCNDSLTLTCYAGGRCPLSAFRG